MNETLRDVLRERADAATPAVDLDEVLAIAARSTRRRMRGMALAAAAATVAVVGVLSTTGETARTSGPVDTPTPTPTPTEEFVIPAGQQTIVPDIRPGDVHGFDVLATVTNEQNPGIGELVQTVTSHGDGMDIAAYCRGDSGLYWFIDIGDGGMNSGTCSPGAATTFPRPAFIGESTFTKGAETITYRMWVTRPSQQWLDCMDSPAPDCNASIGEPQPVAGSGAQFGFRISEHPPMPLVMHLLTEETGDPSLYEFEALSMIRDDAWLLDRAVVAAPGADRLAFELPASDTDSLIDVYDADQNRQRCIDRHEDELPDFEHTDSHVYFALVDELCGVDLQLVVDGEVIRPVAEGNAYKHGHFQELGARLAPGPHRVEVKVVRGNPDNIRFALVVRTLTQLP